MRGLALAFSLVACLQVDAQESRQQGAVGRVTVSEDGRRLIHEDGRPFFYLGDTAWELFHRCDRGEVDAYLSDRASKGYTVIQAVALAELDGLGTPNAYGHLPLVDNDPTRPNIKDGPENDYWDHVDYVIDQAASQGIRVALLPTWGDKWNKKWGVGPEIFTPENARAYGQWLGARYRDKPIIWVLGGDRPVENDMHRAVIEAMAAGLEKGDGGQHLMTFHPTGGHGSAEYFHDAKWLDFNMRQNGHVVDYNGRYDATLADYNRTPVKPVIDAEPIYEDHPISFKAAEFGHSVASDVRRPIYWNLFSGACGHTYGHHSVWQMWKEGRSPVNNPLMPWPQALDQAGAGQMQYAKHLIESRPHETRIPDDSLIVEGRVKTAVPGAGRYRFVATRDSGGRWAMVYAPVGRSFKVRTEKLSGEKLTAWWYDPRTGQATQAGEHRKADELEFTSPDTGEGLDWILVLDDASQNYPPPGRR